MDLYSVGGSRTWKWFAANVRGLLIRPPGSWLEYEDGGKKRTVPVPATRLGFALKPPLSDD